MAISIPEQEIADTYGVIRQTCNGNVLENMMQLAAVMSPLAGSSALADQALAACKSVQAMYNDGFVDSLQGILKDFEELDTIREWLAKNASVGEVSAVDSSFKAGAINADEVMV